MLEDSVSQPFLYLLDLTFFKLPPPQHPLGLAEGRMNVLSELSDQVSLILIFSKLLNSSAFAATHSKEKILRLKERKSYVYVYNIYICITYA